MRADAVLPLPIEVWSGPTVQSLPAEERAALVDLFIAAWRDPAATVPAEDQALAVLSGLGPRWYASRLRAQLASWFDLREDAGRLVCLPLAEASATRARWQAKSRAGGLASAVSRSRSKGVSQLNHPWKGGSTTLGNHPSGGGERSADNSCGERLSVAAPTVAADGGPLGSPAQACAGSGAYAPYAASACAQTKGGSAENGLENGGVCVSHTLLIQERGVQGGKDGSGPIDLFGGKARGNLPDAEDLQAIGAVLHAFLRDVSSAYRPEAKAERAIFAHLCAGLTQENLIDAARNYGREMDALGKQPRYRLSAANFFDPASGHVEAYQRPRQVAQDGAGPTILPMNGLLAAASSADNPFDGIAARVGAKLSGQAPPWYAAWCQRHATRFAFKRPEDADVLARWWDDVGADGYTEQELEAASQALARSARMAEPMSRLQHKTALFNQLKAILAQHVANQAQAKAIVTERNLKAVDPLAALAPEERRAIEAYVRQRNPTLEVGGYLWTAKVLERLRAVQSGAESQSPCGPLPDKGGADVRQVVPTGGSTMPPNR